MLRELGTHDLEQTALAGPPIAEDANGERLKVWRRDRDDEFVDQFVETEQIEIGLVVSPHVPILTPAQDSRQRKKSVKRHRRND